MVHLEAPVFITVPEITQIQGGMTAFNIRSISSSYLQIILNTISGKDKSSIFWIQYTFIHTSYDSNVISIM